MECLNMVRQQRKIAKERQVRRKEIKGMQEAEPGNVSPSSPSDAENPGKKGKKKLKSESKVRHPTQVPPSDLELETFQLKHPFVRLQPFSSSEIDNRWLEYMELDYDTVKEFVKPLGLVVQYFSEVYSCDGDELGVRPLHSGILCFFGKLAQTLTGIPDLNVDGEDRYGTRICLSAGSDAENDEIENDDIELDAMSKGSSREGAVVMHEQGASRVRADFLVQAYDKACIQTNALPRFSDMALCTFLVVESKGNNLPKDWQRGVGVAAQQAASYCILEALKNVSKGREKPINFQVWSMLNWAFGELLVDEVVEVSDGCVYKIMEDGQLVGDAALQAILAAQRTKLRKHLLDIDADFPNGKYLVGTVHTSREVLQFPTTPSLEEPNMDVFRFVQSLLYLFLGKKVLKWKVEHAKRLMAAMAANVARAQDEKCVTGREVYDRHFQRAKRLRTTGALSKVTKAAGELGQKAMEKAHAGSSSC